MSTENKLAAIINSKEAIRTAINGKGGTLTEDSKLSEYAGAIEGLSTGGSGGGVSVALPDFHPYKNNVYNLSGEIVYSTEGTTIPEAVSTLETYNVETSVLEFKKAASERPESTCYTPLAMSPLIYNYDGTTGVTVDSEKTIGIASIPTSLDGLSGVNLKGLSLVIGPTFSGELDFSSVQAPKLKMVHLSFGSGAITKTISNLTVDTLILTAGAMSVTTLTIDSSCHIKNLIVPENVTVNGISAQLGLEYYIPNGGSIPTGYTTLKYYWIPSTATQINSMAFMGCASLYYINIPATVTNIQANAFMGVTSLKRIEMQSATPPTIAVGAFPTNAGLKITVPAGSLSAYQGAPNWSSYTLEERA